MLTLTTWFLNKPRKSKILLAVQYYGCMPYRVQSKPFRQFGYWLLNEHHKSKTWIEMHPNVCEARYLGVPGIKELVPMKSEGF
jgi:hypothetical protein